MYILQHDIKRLNASFQTAIYDDGCHMEEFWGNHPSTEFPGWQPDHYIDPLHSRGHVREKCRSRLSTYNSPLTTCIHVGTLLCDDAADLHAALDPRGRLKKAMDFGEEHIPVGARLRSVGGDRCDPDEVLLQELITAPLPLDVSFLAKGYSAEHQVCLRKESERTKVRGFLSTTSLSIKREKSVRQHPMWDRASKKAYLWPGSRLVRVGGFRSDGVKKTRAALLEVGSSGV